MYICMYVYTHIYIIYSNVCIYILLCVRSVCVWHDATLQPIAACTLWPCMRHAVQAATKYASKCMVLGGSWVKRNDFTERTPYQIPCNVWASVGAYGAARQCAYAMVLCTLSM